MVNTQNENRGMGNQNKEGKKDAAEMKSTEKAVKQEKGAPQGRQGPGHGGMIDLAQQGGGRGRSMQQEGFDRRNQGVFRGRGGFAPRGGGRGRGGAGPQWRNAQQQEDYELFEEAQAVMEEQEQESLEPQPERKFTGRCRLFVGNLTGDCTEEEFKKLFEPYGEFTEVFLNASRGFGFIRMVCIIRLLKLWYVLSDYLSCILVYHPKGLP